jgi:hypothetical protein
LSILFLPWYRGGVGQDVFLLLVLAVAAFGTASMVLIFIVVFFGAVGAQLPAARRLADSSVAAFLLALTSMVLYAWALSEYQGPFLLERDCYFAHPAGLICE